MCVKATSCRGNEYVCNVQKGTVQLPVARMAYSIFCKLVHLFMVDCSSNEGGDQWC